jgi:hypothetical protein
MPDQDYKELLQRVEKLESQAAFGKNSKPKKPRAPSEYNKFMGEFIAKEKKDGSNKSHKEMFTAGAKAWKDSKK